MTTTDLQKRIKSYLWRAAMFGLAAGVGYMLDNLQILELSPLVTAALGLALGEVSKQLNKK
jgi:hypothetical protein